MLPQNGYHLRQQPTNFGPNQQFDPAAQATLFNLNPAQAAKQMTTLNAAGQSRLASNSRNAPISGSGTASTPYIGNISASSYPSSNPELLSNSLNSSANFQIPNSHTIGSVSNSVVNTSFLDPAMAQPNATRNPTQALRQRQHTFLTGLASVMTKRNTPLPPALTGVSTPDYDHTNSPWKLIEPSSEVGSFRLAGKDVNLFKLWGLVQHNGGGHAIANRNGWGLIAGQFELPEEFPQPQANGSTSVANMLSQYYMAILYPFEELYKRNISGHRERMQMAPRPAGASFTAQAAPTMQNRPMQGVSGLAQPNPPVQMQRTATNSMGQSVVPIHGSLNSSTQLPQATHTPTQRPSSATFNSHSGLLASSNTTSITSADSLSSLQQSESAVELGDNILDQDVQGIKRKMEFEGEGNKRARQKTEPPETNTLPTTVGYEQSSGESTQKPGPSLNQAGQPVRRKVEYVPLAREIGTHGGRDLKKFEIEHTNTAPRPLRDINDWGVVDIEALTMSIRSRLSAEISYALTTLTLLSTMRGQTQGTGFPIMQCMELFEELLDFLEEVGFKDSQDPVSTDDGSFVTNRELVNTIIDDESWPFAALRDRQGTKDPRLGPRQRTANAVLVISNLLRNFSLIFDNAKFMSQHERVLSTLLRLCSATCTEGTIRPASPALSLIDLVALRKDVLYALVNFAPFLDLAHSGQTSAFKLAVGRQIVDLVASYLIDSAETVSPYGLVQLSGSVKPPPLADAALEVLTKMSQTDSNRQVIAQAVPCASIRRLFEALVHRLPVADADFQLVMREIWMGYVEKILMAMYSLAFLAPPSVKQRLKKDRRLGFKNVMLRLIRKFLWSADRKNFMVAARRAVETMKVVDDGEDAFDTSETAVTTLAFGMGYGEAGENRVERGTGLLGGQRGMALEMLMDREVATDEVLFKELESLARVESFGFS
ncbi:hypothetical protein APHAL10511_006267 [Amanita phalloides]|nr:hypothetical protein APHAL10511_006267 [Amanita phalloides]